MIDVESVEYGQSQADIGVTSAHLNVLKRRKVDMLQGGNLMKKAYKFNLTVLPENLEMVKKLLSNNKGLFVRTLWSQTEVQIVE